MMLLYVDDLVLQAPNSSVLKTALKEHWSGWPGSGAWRSTTPRQRQRGGGALPAAATAARHHGGVHHYRGGECMAKSSNRHNPGCLAFPQTVLEKQDSVSCGDYCCPGSRCRAQAVEQGADEGVGRRLGRPVAAAGQRQAAEAALASRWLRPVTQAATSPAGGGWLRAAGG